MQLRKLILLILSFLLHAKLLTVKKLWHNDISTMKVIVDDKPHYCRQKPWAARRSFPFQYSTLGRTNRKNKCGNYRQKHFLKCVYSNIRVFFLELVVQYFKRAFLMSSSSDIHIPSHLLRPFKRFWRTFTCTSHAIMWIRTMPQNNSIC